MRSKTMGNHYESEIGHFKGAIRPDVDTFREKLSVIVEMLEKQKNHKLLLYCTGGIRCDVHSNCANEMCHLLFIQCSECAEKFEKCCSTACRDLKNGSETEKQNFRLNDNFKFGNSKVYRKSFRLTKNSNFADPDSLSGQKPTV